MPSCSECPEQPISEAGLCEKHFVEWVERRVLDTVDEFRMILPGERVVVAASGGKDSLTLLNILSRRHEVTALCIDEGIADYREHTIVDLERFCTERGIKLKVVSFKDELGQTLDELNPVHPCSTCGVHRRDLMAKHAEGYDVIATGHNLDDEAQVILMNLFKNHAMRPRPVLEGNTHFVRKVKPLYFIPEADVRRYAYILGLVSRFTECRNANLSFRRDVQHFLENREQELPGSKELLVRLYLQKTVHSNKAP
jgi:tRNA-5-methyluridine54 2-sulfurtransferase